MESGSYLNIDAVQDLVEGEPGIWYDPVLTTGGKRGACGDNDADGACDDGTIVLTALGELVQGAARGRNHRAGHPGRRLRDDPRGDGDH